MARQKKTHDPFRWFDSSPEVIRLVVMMYVRYPLSQRHVEDLVFERGIDICHETVRLWWNRFGPMFASQIRRKPVQHMRAFTPWKWHLDEVYVNAGGECLQVAGRWLNNRVENSHLPFRRRERAMARFRRMKTLQKFSSVHAQVHNHFNQERHLISRDLYRERRSAALAEWRAVMT